MDLPEFSKSLGNSYHMAKKIKFPQIWIKKFELTYKTHKKSHLGNSIQVEKNTIIKYISYDTKAQGNWKPKPFPKVKP